MSFHDRRTDKVYAVFCQLAQENKNAGVVPGQINDVLRQQGWPMGAWEVRGELSKLELAGAIEMDKARAVWTLVDAGKKTNPASANPG